MYVLNLDRQRANWAVPPRLDAKSDELSFGSKVMASRAEEAGVDARIRDDLRMIFNPRSSKPGRDGRLIHTSGTGRETDRLPPSVEDTRQNFIATVQAMAVVGYKRQLLSGIPSRPSPTASSGFSINVGAALSAMIFLDGAGDTPAVFRRLRTTISPASGRCSPSSHADSITSTRTADTGLGLLLKHGSPRSLQFAWHHCVASTIFGTFSILLQICLLAWINISTQVSDVFAVVVLALFWAALPVPGLLLYALCGGFFAKVKKELES
ncbi:hypothetical protein DFH09DRAFT_1275337 [Mycena vulgaris]|nr:hypothetical protein DFH09DRAFT_1275337 [Mycena vulgaris]